MRVCLVSGIRAFCMVVLSFVVVCCAYVSVCGIVSCSSVVFVCCVYEWPTILHALSDVVCTCVYVCHMIVLRACMCVFNVVLTGFV